MRQLKVKIVENKKITPYFYKIRVASDYFAKETKPGQFFEVRCSDTNEPLLRRPLGGHRILKDGVEMLYEVVGKGTQFLSKRKKGENLDVIGPLGNGFTLLRNPILVAGGVGVAPLVALAEDLTKRNNKATVIIGAKKKSHILCEEELKSLGCEVRVATEDGSKGRKGLATDLLKILLLNTKLPAIYACGPTGMLKAVAKIAEAKKIPCQVSLEERMACGVGVCLGCPIKVKTKPKTQNPKPEYKMVCKDGPVFNAEDILW